MTEYVDRLGAALLDASLAATAILGLVILVMVQCRQPARRRGWARAGLMASLVLLPLSALNPVPRIDLWRPLLAILPATEDDRGVSLDPPGDGPGRPGRAIGPDPADPVRHRGPPGPPGPRRAPGWPRMVGRGLVLGYGSGVSLALGWLLLGLWGSTRVIRRARAPSPSAARLFGSLPFEAAWRKPRLLVSDRVGRPVLIGLFWPNILIPPGLDRPEAVDRLRLGLLHELAHAEAGDHLFGPAASLAQALWFFLPPAWWARDRMRLDQEFLADSRAVGHFGTSSRYASSLLSLAQARAPGDAQPPEGPVATSAGAASALFQRILMLLKCPFPIEDRPPAWWRWTTAATVALATLAASCLTLRGIAAWVEDPRPRATDAARSFRLPQLVIAPDGDDTGPFDLRLRLPDRFTLTLDVLAGPADLSALEILGHRLGGAGAGDPAGPTSPAWHPVEIRRVGGAEVVRVDGRPCVDRDAPGKLAHWLTIRPMPGQPTRIRDLYLSW